MGFLGTAGLKTKSARRQEEDVPPKAASSASLSDTSLADGDPVADSDHIGGRPSIGKRLPASEVKGFFGGRFL